MTPQIIPMGSITAGIFLLVVALIVALVIRLARR